MSINSSEVTEKDYWIKDCNLSNLGKNEIEIASISMPGIQELLRVYGLQKPLAGARITGCVTVTKETAVLIRALVSLGAEVRWCSDNQHAINDAVSAALVEEGIPVFGIRNESLEEYYWSMQRALEFVDSDGVFIGPTQIIDDGCDITRYIVKHCPEVFTKIKGVAEQTTCGIREVLKLYEVGSLPTTVINVNDSFIKKFFDNYYGIKESFISALFNTMSVQVSGKNVVVYGYGPVGKGCIDVVKGIGGKPYLVEVDILKAIQAHMDGIPVISHQEALTKGDIFVTATGCINVIKSEDFYSMNDGAILCNVGHGTEEYEVKHLDQNPKILKRELNDDTREFTLPNGKKIYSLCKGALINMIASGGNPPFIMNLTFTSHLLVQIDLHCNSDKYHKKHIHELPLDLSRKVAKMSFPEVFNKLYTLNTLQKEYLGGY